MFFILLAPFSFILPGLLKAVPQAGPDWGHQPPAVSDVPLIAPQYFTCGPFLNLPESCCVKPPRTISRLFKKGFPRTWAASLVIHWVDPMWDHWGPLAVLYLVQVSVAPHLPVSKHSGDDPSLAVVFPLFCGWTPLKARYLSRTGHTQFIFNLKCLFIKRLRIT